MSIFKDMDGYFYVHPTNIFQGKVEIDNVEELESSFKVVKPKTLASSVYVSKSNIMKGNVDIVENLIEESSIEPVKDAFVRSSNPIFNFGKAQDLLVGKNNTNGEVYRTFIEFQSSLLPTNIKITKAVIRLTASQYTEFIPNLKLYSVNSFWSEQGITWNNQPELDKLIAEVDSVVGERYIDFDITHIIDDWYNEKNYQNGFALVSDDESFNQFKRFFSRESNYTPLLAFEYYDLNPASYGGITVDSAVNVLYPEQDELNSTIIVNRYEREEDLSSTVYTRIIGEMESIIITSKPVLDSSVFVSGINELNSTFTITGYELDDLNSIIRLSADYVYSTLIVQRNEYKDLSSSFTVKRNELDDLQSSIIALQPFLNSTIEVTRCLDLLSELIVNREHDYDTVSYFGIKRDEINSIIQVLVFDDLDSALLVKRNEEKDLNSTFRVKREEAEVLNSVIEVTWFSDLLSTIQVLEVGEKLFSSTFTVLRHDFLNLESTIHITNYRDLPSIVNTRELGDSNLKSTILVINHDENDFNSIVDITMFNNMPSVIGVINEHFPSTLIVLNEDLEDLNSTITVSQANDLNSTIYVNQLTDFISVIHVNHPYLNSTLKVSPNSDLYSSLEIIYYNDLDGKFDVIYPSAEDILSKLEVIEQGGLNSVIRVNRELLDGLIIVNHPALISRIVVTKNNLPSKVEILPTKDMNGKLIVQHIKDLDSKFDILYPDADDLLSTVDVMEDGSLLSRVNISKDNLQSTIVINKDYLSSRMIVVKRILESTVEVIGVGKEDLNSAIIIHNDNAYLDSVISVYAHNIMQGKTRFEQLIELLSTIRVESIQDSDIYSTVSVAPHNKMEGKIEIVRPDPQDEVLYPIRDSFVVSTSPYMNYGDTTDMYVGRLSDGRVYRSFVHFLLGELPKNIEFIEAKLIITNLTLNPLTSEIELYEVDSEWYEMGITWANKPSPLNYITSLSGNEITKSTLEFDLMSVIDEWYKGEKIKHGFMLKSSDESLTEIKRMFTKEGSYPPVLKLKYYDLDSENNLVIDVPSSIIIKRNEDCDLNSTLEVEDYQRLDDLPSGLNVENIIDLDATVITSKGDLDSTVEITPSAYNDLSSTVIANTRLIEQINSVVRASNPNLKSTAVVMRHEINELNSTLVALYPKYDDLHSSLVIQRYDDSNLSSTIKVFKSNLDSTIEVTPNGNLESTVFINRNEDYDIYSILEVTNVDDLYSTFEVDNSGVLDSTLTVRHHSEDELDGCFKVTPTRDLQSLIIIPHLNDLSSKLIIRNETENDLESEVYVFLFDDINSTITVLNGEYSELHSKFDILESHVDDIYSTFIIDSNKDLNSTFAIPHSDMASTILIDELSSKYLNSTVYITNYSDMDSTVTVIHHDNISLDSVIIALKHNESNINSTVFVENHSDLNSLVKVISIYDIPSTVVIYNANAEDLESVIVVDYGDDLHSRVDVSEGIIGYAFIF